METAIMGYTGTTIEMEEEDALEAKAESTDGELRHRTL